MGRRALVVLIAMVVGACSGGGGAATGAPGTPAGGGGTATTAPATLGSSAAPSAAPTTAPTIGGGLPQETLRPSGAKVRVINLYSASTGDNPSLDIYGSFAATTGLLVATVPYATVSDWFDPGILDDQGDADITFYPAGKTDRNELLGDQRETLKGTERITLVISNADNMNAAGKPFAHWRTIFENDPQNPPPSPPAGKAVLIVDGLGLLKTFPGSTDSFLYVGVDGTCLPSVDMGPQGGAQPAGPDSVQSYIFPPGAHDVTFHITNPDCTGKGTYDSLHVDLKAGQGAYLFFYSPDGKALKELLAPLGQ